MPLSPMIEIVVAVCGVALIVTAAAAQQPWLDRHFLPSFFMSRHAYVMIETIVRVAIAATGALLVVGRARIARLLTRSPAMVVSIIAAAALATGASDLALRTNHPRPVGWLVPEEEPRRQPDPYLGWVLAPSRTGRAQIGGRTVEYAIDGEGYRVNRVDGAPDRERPTLVFAGESIMFGEGLTWDESIPAQVAAMNGVQSANLAVHGFSTDQMYLRIARELPRFRRPRAVIAIFMPELFGRNLDRDRPHLGPGLAWLPAVRESRLKSLATLLVPFRRDATVEQGVRVTREALLAIADLAHQRGATPLVVVPQFGSEDDLQRSIRTRVLGTDIPSLLVPLDPAWRLAWDRHPDARAAHVMAAAVAARLQAR